MSILDDAIREHLELKRQHGADDAELKRLEDEAFGPPARPEEELDPFAEAPTEFLTAPGGEGELADGPATELLGDEPDSGRRINVADLQEPPPPPEAPAPPAVESEPPAEEEHPAMEHEVVDGPIDDDEVGPGTEERHAIAEQPTEIFDVEGQFDAAGEASSPSDEQLADAELNEPRLAPVDPIEGIEASAGTAADAPPSDEEIEEHADEFDEFFSEQRLSDELNQALEAPVEDEPAFPDTEEAEGPPPPEDEEATAIHPVQDPQRNFEEEDDEEAGLGASEADEDDEEDDDHPASHHEDDHQDALEDTPDFLAEDPEDENLWFEQKPPKDIDFGD